jgi:hypothetical protein
MEDGRPPELEGMQVIQVPGMTAELFLHACQIRTSKAQRPDGLTAYLLHFDLPFGLTITVPFDEGGFANAIKGMQAEHSGIHLP